MMIVYALVLFAGAVMTVIAARRRTGALTPALIGTILGAFAVLAAASIGMYLAILAALVLTVAGARLGRVASCVLLAALAALAAPANPAFAQCPDGSPPPCSRPARPEARVPRPGDASIRVLTSTPISGTTLKAQDLVKGVPLHVVVEHAVQRVPAGQRPVLVAFVNLTPDAAGKGYQRVLDARLIASRPTQRGLDLTLTTDHVSDRRITVAIHVAFTPASDSALTSSQGMRLSFDWGASITLEFPVADSTGAAGVTSPAVPGFQGHDATSSFTVAPHRPDQRRPRAVLR